MRRALASLALAATTVLAVACAPAGSAGSGNAPPPDPRNATYRIEKDVLTITNGKLEREAAPGSATKIVTTVTDVQATGDVDGDARPDTIVVLLDQPGGSGSFSYLAVLLNASNGVTATPAVLLGDRIAATSLHIDGKTIIVEFLDHASAQPMAASPTVPVTKRFVVDAGVLKSQ